MRVLLLCAAPAALHILGALGQVTFLLAVVMLSFRVSGSYVLLTIVGRPYRGFDGWVALLLAGALASSFLPGAPRLGSLGLPAALIWLAMGLMIARNLWDLRRHYRQIVPA